MRIISKYKDYYDYFQGIFGMDMNKVFTRKDYILFESASFFAWNTYKVHLFAINRKIYVLIEYKDKKFYLPTKENYKKLHVHHETITEIEELMNRDSSRVKANIELREPIVYGTISSRSQPIWESGSPIMKTFDFHKVMDAKELYIEVETFLGYLKDHPEIPNKQSNKEKIVSHGFDLKKSFRHRK